MAEGTEGLMDLPQVIHIKEKVAICGAFTPEERDFILSSINVAIGLQDKNAVHLMLLRGDIARPNWEQITHIYQRSRHGLK